ncbi:hypothetical protein [Paenibacillus hunanensis]|uniref:DUF5658 domain-containing protein n=1 Tax=Paenibacillus hunanensis TaxID=539262 RepID=A0ABU1IYK6_9BACL|nr:hypothetical protein [Paenibacillus hunanensis]MDR6243447.1 hypothetical protein [Paenibacillus hunanensis]GGI97801.1 hypothetical protein GCM10008022_03110 [Paenibacillus hunanensis]
MIDPNPIKDTKEKIINNRKIIISIDDRLMIIVMLCLLLLIFLKIWFVLSLHIPILINPTFLSGLKFLNDPLPFHIIVLGLIIFNLKTKIRSIDKKYTWLILILTYLLSYDFMVGLLYLMFL